MLLCMSDVTQILSAIEQGDPSAAEQLLPLVYNELRQLEASRLAHEKSGQTLQATALVHESVTSCPVCRKITGNDRGTDPFSDSRPDDFFLLFFWTDRRHSSHR